jgi:hypothetical protein
MMHGQTQIKFRIPKFKESFSTESSTDRVLYSFIILPSRKSSNRNTSTSTYSSSHLIKKIICGFSIEGARAPLTLAWARDYVDGGSRPLHLNVKKIYLGGGNT